jgi:hypothetical protein
MADFVNLDHQTRQSVSQSVSQLTSQLNYIYGNNLELCNKSSKCIFEHNIQY